MPPVTNPGDEDVSARRLQERRKNQRLLVIIVIVALVVAIGSLILALQGVVFTS